MTRPRQGDAADEHGHRRLEYSWGPICAVFLLVLITASRTWAQARTGAAVEARVDRLLERMTRDEKFGQLQQLGGNGQTGQLLAHQRELVKTGQVGSLFNVRGTRNTNEVQHLALAESPSRIPILFAFDVLHGYRTIFPVPLGQASSWDPTAVEQAARIGAAEASSAGVRGSLRRWLILPATRVGAGSARVLAKIPISGQ